MNQLLVFIALVSTLLLAYWFKYLRRRVDVFGLRTGPYIAMATFHCKFGVIKIEQRLTYKGDHLWIYAKQRVFHPELLSAVTEGWLCPIDAARKYRPKVGFKLNADGTIWKNGQHRREMNLSVLDDELSLGFQNRAAIVRVVEEQEDDALRVLWSFPYNDEYTSLQRQSVRVVEEEIALGDNPQPPEPPAPEVIPEPEPEPPETQKDRFEMLVDELSTEEPKE